MTTITVPLRMDLQQNGRVASGLCQRSNHAHTCMGRTILRLRIRITGPLPSGPPGGACHFAGTGSSTGLLPQRAQPVGDATGDLGGGVLLDQVVGWDGCRSLVGPGVEGNAPWGRLSSGIRTMSYSGDDVVQGRRFVPGHAWYCRVAAFDQLQGFQCDAMPIVARGTSRKRWRQPDGYPFP